MRQKQRAFKAQTTDADFIEWQERNYLRVLKMSIEAEREWIEHLHVSGIDTSGFPSNDVFVPELGITYHQVFFPDELKLRFQVWLNTDYFPRFFGIQVKKSKGNTANHKKK